MTKKKSSHSSIIVLFWDVLAQIAIRKKEIASKSS